MSQAEDDAAITARRVQRARVELKEEGVRASLSDAVIEEFVYARYMPVHEGLRPAYGAIVCGSSKLTQLGGSQLASDLSGVRKYADGSNAFITRDPSDRSASGLINVRVDNEAQALAIAAATDGTLVRRDEFGTITIISDEAILVNSGFDWRVRPIARTRMYELGKALDLTKIQALDLVARLVDFAFHQLSPELIGATLVVDLQGAAEYDDEALSHPGYEPAIRLNLANLGDARLMSTFLRVVDGAILVTSGGDVARTQVKLRSQKDTSNLLGPDRGTRHSSAKWFSYEHPDALVIVVSADGPVSIYSDGARAAHFDNDPPKDPIGVLEALSGQAANIVNETQVSNCPTCRREIATRIQKYPAQNRTIEVKCPVCSTNLLVISAMSATSTPRKPWADGAETASITA